MAPIWNYSRVRAEKEEERFDLTLLAGRLTVRKMLMATIQNENLSH
jgi:hypothetical protein